MAHGASSVNHFDFESRLGLMDVANRTEAAGDYTWGVSVIKIGALYHAYIARWINTDGISGFIYYGKIYHASSANRLGPFNSMTELTELRGQVWTAGAVFNPVPIVIGDTIYLYWTGTTVETPVYPITGTPARDNQRIGVASTSITSPGGPFTLYAGNPILSPGAGGSWDELLIANPYPFMTPNGDLKMIYKSANVAAPDTLKIATSTTVANNPFGPWSNAATPITSVTNIEESAIWTEGEFTFMITKAQDNTYVENQNGILLYNKDRDVLDAGWTLVTSKTRAYRLTSKWTTFASDLRTRIERPYVLVEDGVPTAFYTCVLFNPDTGSFNIGREIRS